MSQSGTLHPACLTHFLVIALMDAELHLAPDSSATGAWLEAPMPGAVACGVESKGLCDRDRSRRFALHGDLYRRLGGAAATKTLLAQDQQGQLWRIRPCGGPEAGAGFLLQSLAESRFSLAALLRSAMAQRLAGHVLHELRNPLNALSLYTDVLNMLLPRAGDPGALEKAATALKSIKERLQELTLRQQATVVLWCGEDRLESPIPISAIWRDVSRLMAAFLTLKTIPLQSQGLELLEQCPLACPRALLALAWIGLLMMAADAAELQPEGHPERRLQLHAAAASSGLRMTVAGPMASSALGVELGVTHTQGAAALLSLLVYPGPAAIELAPDGGMVLSLTTALP